jgi:hypothetical protein
LDHVPDSFEFILWLDADDVLLDQDRQKFQLLKQNLATITANSIMMTYQVLDEDGLPVLKWQVPRMVRRASHFRWVGRIHEYLDGPGPVATADVSVTHRPARAHTDRNLRIYEQMRAAGQSFTVRDCLYYANELSQNDRYLDALPLYEQVAADESAWVEDRIWALNQLAELLTRSGDAAAARHAVYRTFDLDAPRSEACCRLGYDALQRHAPRAAVFWYRAALQVAHADSMGFRLEACHSWLPHLQLAVAYDQLGELEVAAWHNDQAAVWRPHDPAVLHNRAYFQHRGVTPRRPSDADS